MIEDLKPNETITWPAKSEAIDFMDPDAFPELLNTQLALLKRRLAEARAKKEALRLEIKELVKRETQWERAVKAFTAKEKTEQNGAT